MANIISPMKVRIFYVLTITGGNAPPICFIVLDRCKEFDALNGYNYKTYFHLSDLKHSTPKDEELININLIILGSKDAHILLTSSTDPDITAPVYEIGKTLVSMIKTNYDSFELRRISVLGAGANTFCEIRKKRKGSPLKNKRVQVLSPIDPVPITIRITRCKCNFYILSVFVVCFSMFIHYVHIY